MAGMALHVMRGHVVESADLRQKANRGNGSGYGSQSKGRNKRRGNSQERHKRSVFVHKRRFLQASSIIMGRWLARCSLVDKNHKRNGLEWMCGLQRMCEMVINLLSNFTRFRLFSADYLNLNPVLTSVQQIVPIANMLGASSVYAKSNRE